jgi:hypothetical protein
MSLYVDPAEPLFTGSLLIKVIECQLTQTLLVSMMSNLTIPNIRAILQLVHTLIPIEKTKVDSEEEEVIMLDREIQYEIAALTKLAQALAYYAKIESDTYNLDITNERLLRKHLILTQSANEINIQLNRIGKMVATKITKGESAAIPFANADVLPQNMREQLLLGSTVHKTDEIHAQTLIELADEEV